MKKIIIALGAIFGSIISVIIIGYILPVSHITQRTEILKSDKDIIYNVLTNVKEYPSWRKDIMRIETIDDKHWKEHNFDGDIIEYEIKIIQMKSKWNVVILNKNLPYGGFWNFELTKNGASSQLTIVEHGEVYNPIFRFVSKFVIGHTVTIETYFKNLRKKLGE